MAEPGPVLAKLFGRGVRVVTDTATSAFAEMQVGAAAGVETFLFVKAATGVGAGVVIGGRLHTGASGLAGEIGHTRVSGATQRCDCGNVGCLETLVEIDALAAELPPPYGREALWSPTTGDAVVDRVVADAGRVVGEVLAPVCNALNPALIVTGGQLGSVHGEAFTKGVREAIDRFAQPSIAQALTVRPTALGLRADIIGAVLLARRAALA